MSEETENKPQGEQEVKEEAVDTIKDEKEEEKDFVPQLYSQHGGDPRQCDLSYCVLLSGIPTDLLTDSYEQFDGTIKTMLKVGHNISKEAIKQIIRIPVLDEKALNSNKALRALIWFSDKMQQCRCLAGEKKFSEEKQKVELIEVLPEDFLQISDEDRAVLENGVHERIEENDDEDVVGDEVDEDVGDEVEELLDEDEGHDEHDEDENNESKKEEDEHMEEGDDNEEKKEKKDDDKKVEKKPEEPKKKVYEDDDEKAPFEMEWEGAPEFQWRLCEGNRDEKKLIIDNLMWADLNNVFIYRTIQKATTCEINFPTRFAGEGGRANYGKMTLYFPAFVAIMDEALKHLIYFRSGDNRRIKVFLPQTVVSLKRKEEFEGKLGRLIKPTQRMMELVIKILPEDYIPTLDDACSWFPDQSVIGCELVNDEMGRPCAVVQFETAQEAVTAHASKSFVTINRKFKKESDEKTEKSEKEDAEENDTTQCNVFMRGVEAHFGSLLTFYDQRKKAQEQNRIARASKRGPSTSTTQKRPAGSTIRGPAQKKRAPSPKSRGGPPHGKDSTPRGGQRGGAPRNAGRGGGASGGGGAPRRSSPPRSHARSGGSGPRGPARGGGPSGGSHSRGGSGGSRGGSGGSRGGSGGSRGGRSSIGDRGVARAPPPRSTNYRNDFSSSSSSQRGPARADAFSGYGYASFENRYNSGGNNDRPSVDPFGRPMFNTLAFSHSSSSSSSFHRDDSHRSGGGGGNSSGGYSSFQE
ncbi:hypothetical protein CAEBREN_16231 [Caenorhabditis brenneri]|uniref:Uncharacterized protein n=1 Tax=Caenorhabditis brenneri TaxID=135651 RepID=G0N014_CAEBE|nr:hypothetical protein CAEBREN_16231 [Caenorhabditis brenneri]